MATPQPAPTTQQEVLTHYQQLHRCHQVQSQLLLTRRTRTLQALAVTLGAILLVTFRSLRSDGPAWPLAALLAAAMVLIWISIRFQGKLTREQRLLAAAKQALARTDGSQSYSDRTGNDPKNDLRPPGHLFAHDLDLLGPNSLFALLATVRTGPGERGLARYLLEPATHAESFARRQAVQELLPHTHLREQIALLGTTRFHQISATFFDEWLADSVPSFHPVFRVALGLTATLACGILLTGFLRLRPWSELLPNLAVVLAVQCLVSVALRSRVLPLLQGGARLQHHVRMIADGLAILQQATFTVPKLLALQSLSRRPAGAVKLLNRLQSHLSIVEQRPKEYFLLLSLLLAAGTQAAIGIATWKRQHAAAMAHWIEAWAEFEALNALATYAFEHPVVSEHNPNGQHAWPELLPDTHPPLYEAQSLRHPLLPAALPNDVSLAQTPGTPDPAFYLISGSNMAGKSTLLRSVGINAVLAYAGAPVRATSLRLTPLALGASLALTDSLVESKSKFLAEVERLAAIVRLSRTRPVLFLVDEIFSGTNSLDRRTAAAAVLQALLASQAIGAFSTHDLALTELATPTNRGLNLHMASPNPDDPLAFDYQLKPGINTHSNALAIVRLLGLDVEDERGAAG